MNKLGLKQTILIIFVIVWHIFAMSDLWEHRWLGGSVKLIIALIAIIIYSDVDSLKD